ncbi:limkain-b1-type NYN domain-containing protein, partial [Mycena capillaripes]
GYEIVSGIRSVAHRFGPVKHFKAYMEVPDPNTSRSFSLRSELQSSGVSLTDCPHKFNGRKNVADQMIMVDMLAYAMDHPAPATLILISGDRDFAYAVSILRLRRYEVVVISLPVPGAHISLKSQASVYLDW